MRIHFIGIGGIGVSALAKYYLKKGHQVSGSDLVSSEITQALKKQGVKIIAGKHKAENLPQNTDMAIYSPAVQSSNPEFKKAQKLKIVNCKLKIKSYPEALGELTKQYFTIAVAGTHGKSSTTAMLGLLLAKAGLDPTVIVGTKVKEFVPSAGGSNCRVGKPVRQAQGRPVRQAQGKIQYLVIEADEHFASFLNYWPKIIVLTAIEADHLDYYKNFKNYISVFKKFVSHLPKDGLLIVNGNDKNTKRIIFNRKISIKKYSLKQPEAKKLKKILKVPGEHNVSNALAALAVARVLKIPDKVSFKALSEYKGCWRRFDEKNIKIKNKNLRLVNDYGHHPTEIKVTLKAVREKYKKEKICCVYQPHQYQRTHYLFKDFINVFKESAVKKWIDKLIITDVYDVAGREEKKIKERVNSQKLVKAVNKSNVIYLPKEKIIDYLKNNLKNREVLIIMGAGDIYELNLKLKSNQ